MSSPELQELHGPPASRVSAPSLVAERAQSPGQVRGRIDSSSLLQGMRELLIAHAGEEYRLRLTRNDKLILTK